MDRRTGSRPHQCVAGAFEQRHLASAYAVAERHHREVGGSVDATHSCHRLVRRPAAPPATLPARHNADAVPTATPARQTTPALRLRRVTRPTTDAATRSTASANCTGSRRCSSARPIVYEDATHRARCDERAPPPTGWVALPVRAGDAHRDEAAAQAAGARGLHRRGSLHHVAPEAVALAHRVGSARPWPDRGLHHHQLQSSGARTPPRRARQQREAQLIRKDPGLVAVAEVRCRELRSQVPSAAPHGGRASIQSAQE